MNSFISQQRLISYCSRNVPAYAQSPARRRCWEVNSIIFYCCDHPCTKSKDTQHAQKDIFLCTKDLATTCKQ